MPLLGSPRNGAFVNSRFLMNPNPSEKLFRSQHEMKPAKAISLAIGCFLMSACGPTRSEPSAPPSSVSEEQATTSREQRPASCPEQAAAPQLLPNVSDAHFELAYWLEQQSEYGDIDAPLLSVDEIAAQNRALGEGLDPIRQPPLRDALPEGWLARQLRERLGFVRERLLSGTYLKPDGERFVESELGAFSEDAFDATTPELRIALGNIPVRCAPLSGSYVSESLDLDFDRNNCSTILPQEPLEILGETAGLRLVRTRYTLGWIREDASLSRALTPEERTTYFEAERGRIADVVEVRDLVLSPRVPLPVRDGRALLWDTAGQREESLALAPASRPITRRAVLEEAFRYLGHPYGWGGRAGEQDCSRFVLDILGSFNLHVPRHSARQAQAGTFVLDVQEMGRDEKVLAMESALERGIVLLQFPGHIMLYLGKDASGIPMAAHSFSEYLVPCEGTELETTRRADRVTISDLSLGEGSSRTDFLSRLTKIVVFGSTPGIGLQGAAQVRPVGDISYPGEEAACEDSTEVAIFRTPFRPNPQSPMRVIVTASEDPGPVELALFNPEGTRVDAEVHRLGGPPYSYWAEIAEPTPGRWTAVLGDGPRQVACERFGVARHPPAHPPRLAETPAWVPVWSWEADTENLYSAFIEQLFREREDGEQTWSNLQELLSDRSRNLLYNHRLMGEDEALALRPDCADLPYFLRAYFAWKARLPFAWRRCRRGREGVAPACDARFESNLMPVTANSDVAAFQQVIRSVKRAVHSSTQRTPPDQESTDVYPIALTRETLRPGTVFADPYGHILMIAGYRDQTFEDYGVLIGADAQPDNTVGRRRFWRGSFLFTPETQEAGAGFKAWRPVSYDRVEQELVLLDNAALRQTNDFARFDRQQYEGTRDDFYDAMDAVINPRPLDPSIVMRSLVSAFAESVRRRVNSVDNGEGYMAEHGYATVTMPEGASIFQTEGAWENFSTPSRDMRLLISADAVVGFPQRVARNPGRFGVDESAASERVQRLQDQLNEALRGETFTYRRSDGSEVELTLETLVGRLDAMEMAYNPNDCPEIRWGADPASDEGRTCRRQAPREQRARMQSLRGWFHTRQRPAR